VGVVGGVVALGGGLVGDRAGSMLRGWLVGDRGDPVGGSGRTHELAWRGAIVGVLRVVARVTAKGRAVAAPASVTALGRSRKARRFELARRRPGGGIAGAMR
jgi:hypothetical protein